MLFFGSIVYTQCSSSTHSLDQVQLCQASRPSRWGHASRRSPTAPPAQDSLSLSRGPVGSTKCPRPQSRSSPSPGECSLLSCWICHRRISCWPQIASMTLQVSYKASTLTSSPDIVLLIAYFPSTDFEDVIATVSYFMEKNKNCKFWTSYQERRWDCSVNFHDVIITSSRCWVVLAAVCGPYFRGGT